MINKIKEYFQSEKGKADVKEWVDTIVFVVIAVIIIRFFFGEIRWIPSGSMHPTLLEGDRIVVERMTRFYKAPERGDVMVFYPPFVELKHNPWALFSRLTGFFCKDVAFIKRVIGLPNEKFEIKQATDGSYAVYINDEKLEEPYIVSKYDFTPCSDPRVNCGPFIIPEDEYLMLGDNRGASYDGRFWGTLPRKNFIGKAVVLFWPVNRIKLMKNPQS